MTKSKRDEELIERLQLFDGLVQEGKIPCSSKVVPVLQSLQSLQWILPTQQMLEILRNSRSFALANCACRTACGQCDNPLEVCLYINDVADKTIALKKARRITLDEAAAVLQLANSHGLVHLTFYNPEQHVYALCSCCECCCHDIAFMKRFGRPDLIAHADYVAVVDSKACVQCATCVQRCIFGAQRLENAEVVFRQESCYGCGLCVSTCPAKAIRMRLRESQPQAR